MKKVPAQVRAANASDAAGICAVYRPYVLDTDVSFEEEPPDQAEVLRRMLEPPRLPWLVAEREGVVAGYAYAALHRRRPAYRWSVDCSVYLVEAEQGRGTARALYEQLLHDLGVLGYKAAFAGIALPNEASVRLHESFGFVPVGVFRSVGFKHGAWHDVGWWERSLREASAALPEPRGWSPGRSGSDEQAVDPPPPTLPEQ